MISRTFVICLEHFSSKDEVHLWNGTWFKVSILRYSPPSWWPWTTVYRKVTNKDVYLNYYSFCPREWKRETFRSLVQLETFRSLVQRAYIICSSSHLLQEELKHLKDVFIIKNNFTIWAVKKILKEEKEKIVIFTFKFYICLNSMFIFVCIVSIIYLSISDLVMLVTSSPLF